MGKVRRLRQKYHLSTKQAETSDKELPCENSKASLPVDLPKSNLFEGINFDFSKIKKDLSDDVRSVKSLKSLKHEAGGENISSKKDKLKLRRERLLKKINTVVQLKKEHEVRKKRKNVAIIGDTNPLHDALPSLESLMKSKGNASISYKQKSQGKAKGIQKAIKRKKQFIQGVNVFKMVLSNNNFKKNPLQIISEHCKAVVDKERGSSNKK